MINTAHKSALLENRDFDAKNDVLNAISRVVAKVPMEIENIVVDGDLSASAMPAVIARVEQYVRENDIHGQFTKNCTDAGLELMNEYMFNGGYSQFVEYIVNSKECNDNTKTMGHAMLWVFADCVRHNTFINLCNKSKFLPNPYYAPKWQCGVFLLHCHFLMGN